MPMPLKLWYHCPCSDIAWSGLVCVFKIHFVRHSMPCYVLFLDTQSCPTVCDPMDCIFPGSSVHGISPGKNTGVGCHSFLWGSSPPRDWTQVSRVASGFFIIWATREIHRHSISLFIKEICAEKINFIISLVISMQLFSLFFFFSTLSHWIFEFLNFVFIILRSITWFYLMGNFVNV